MATQMKYRMCFAFIETQDDVSEQSQQRCRNVFFVGLLHSVLRPCWLGGRKGIKLSGEVLAWLSVWSEVQMLSMSSNRCHCHPIMSSSSKIKNGLLFWCRLTQVVQEKRLLNGCSSSSSSAACSW